MKPKYYVAYADEPEHGITCDMLYAVYPDICFYQSGTSWMETSLRLDAFEPNGLLSSYHPCFLKDVRAFFNNVSAHKRDNTNKTVGILPA